MRYAIAILACLLGFPVLACDYSLSGVACPSATVYASPAVVQAQVYAAPAVVQYAAPAVAVQQVQVQAVYAQPTVVQRAFMPSYPYGGAVAVQRSAFVPSYGASFGVQRSFGVSAAAVVRSPAIVQQDVVARRGFFGRREVVRSRTVIR